MVSADFFAQKLARAAQTFFGGRNRSFKTSAEIAQLDAAVTPKACHRRDIPPFTQVLLM
jgi:hypothetical protein